MLKNFKAFGSSLNGIPFESGRKMVKLRRKSCLKNDFPSLGLDNRYLHTHCRPLIANIHPNSALGPNKKPASFLEYSRNLQIRQVSDSRCLKITAPPPNKANSSHFLQKSTYSNFVQGQNSQEPKTNNKLVSDESYMKVLKDNIQSLLEKQMNHINDVRTKRVKKDIKSVVNLQKMVVNKIREGNQQDMIPQQKSPEPFLSAEKNATRARYILEKLEGERTSSLVPMKVDHNSQPRIIDNLKSKYNNEIAHEKLVLKHPQNEESLWSKHKKRSENSDANKSDSFPPMKLVQNNLHRTFNTQQENSEIANIEKMVPTSKKEIMNALKSKTDKILEDMRVQPQISKNISRISEAMKAKQRLNHVQNSLKVFENLERKSFRKDKLHNSFTVQRKKPEVLSPSLLKGEKGLIKTNIMTNELESIANKREKNLPMPRGVKEESVYKPRDRRPRPLPNYVRDNPTKDMVEFSHKGVHLRDYELYRKFRQTERERQLRTIYNAHWGEKLLRDFDVRTVKPSLTTSNRLRRIVKPTEPAVVHKLNASSIAENIRLRAKIINNNKRKEELLQPQVYCKKSLGLAQLPIMPCKNLVQRDAKGNSINRKKPIILGTGAQKHHKGNKLYTQSLKKSRPLWTNQKMITSNFTHQNSRKKNTVNKRKIDFKGALKYIMSFKSRLEQQ